MTPEQFDAWFARLYEGDGAVFRVLLGGIGLRIVPVEPTEAMCAAWETDHDFSPAGDWASMLAASPFAKEG